VAARAVEAFGRFRAGGIEGHHQGIDASEMERSYNETLLLQLFQSNACASARDRIARAQEKHSRGRAGDLSEPLPEFEFGITVADVNFTARVAHTSSSTTRLLSLF
jgi:hypothetical protein